KELGVAIIASLFERRVAGVFHNTAAIIDSDGKFLGKYRKMHIPDDPLYHEKFYFTPGDLGFQAWATQPGKVGVCICWDQWYPEAARLTALRGAEIIFYPTAIGWHPAEKKEFGAAQHHAWETIQRSHAIANGCYVAAANRVGHEAPAGGEGIEFWGQSFICGPDGEIISKGSVDKEEIVMGEVEWARVNEFRTHWPFLRDRRVDAYGELNRRLIDRAKRCAGKSRRWGKAAPGSRAGLPFVQAFNHFLDAADDQREPIVIEFIGRVFGRMIMRVAKRRSVGDHHATVATFPERPLIRPADARNKPGQSSPFRRNPGMVAKQPNYPAKQGARLHVAD